MQELANQWPVRLERPFQTLAQSPPALSRGQHCPNDASQSSNRRETFAPHQKLEAKDPGDQIKRRPASLGSITNKYMIQFIIIVTIILVIAASLLHLAKCILVGILTIFYKDEAPSIADALVAVLLWVLGICGASLLIWGLFSLFGATGTAIILIIVFAVLKFLSSF